MQEISENFYTCSLSCTELSLWNALWNVKKKKKIPTKKEEKNPTTPKLQVSIKLIDMIPVFGFLEASLIYLCLFEVHCDKYPLSMVVAVVSQ